MNAKKNVLMVATVQSHIAQFHIPLIKKLKKSNYNVEVAARNNLREKKGLSLDIVDNIYDIPFTRNPISINNIKSYIMMKKILKKGNYKIVHCNTPMGSVITRLAAKKYRKKGMKVIYTSHGFHFFKGAPLKNWLLYYPIEKYLSKYTDAIITINHEDYNFAIKKFSKSCPKIVYIPGVGVELNNFSRKRINKKQKCKDLGIPNDKIIILSIGELNKNKNHIAVLKSLSELKNNNLYYIICGNGPLKQDLMNFAKEKNIEHQFKLLGYRRDISEILSISDIFVFPSYREGLPVSLLEATCSGITIVASNIRGTNDIADLVPSISLFNPNDYLELKRIINRIIDKKLYLNKNNTIEQINKYSINNVVEKMYEIYLK